jgi:hypothetical protein
MISSLLLAATFASLGLELPALLAQFMLGFTCLHFGLLGFWVLLRGGYRDWKGHAREGLCVRFEGFLLMLLAWGFLAWGLLSAP